MPQSPSEDEQYLRFANVIELMEGSNEELQKLTDGLSNSVRAYGMEVSSEKIKIPVNSDENTTAQISMNGHHLEEVAAFKYLGAGAKRMDATPRK